MMEKSYDYIKENYKRIEDNVFNTAIKNGRNPKDITILGATKTVSADKINYAIENGLKCVGENRVQELMDKYDSLNLSQTNCHFIGALQTNKIKYIADKVSMIHSIENIRQIKELSKQMSNINSVMKVLVEVNIGEEESKSGVHKEKLLEFLEEIGSFSGIKVEGLMCIPPICEEKHKIYKYFTEISQYYIDIGTKKLDNIDMTVLSMGMSDDYIEAVECGSNLIRVGSALFGNRIYNK